MSTEISPIAEAIQLLHASHGASSSAKWLTCAGALKMEEGLKDERSSFAALGTAAHAVGEHCLINRITDAHSQIGNKHEGHIVDEEMADAVQQYLDYVYGVFEDGDVLLIEQRVNYGPLIGINSKSDGFGTADVIIIKKDGTCYCIDYKHGSGMLVDVVKNTQAMLYGLGVLNDYGVEHEIKNFVLTIVQPRMNNIVEWDITTNKLLNFAQYATKRVDETMKKEPDLTPSAKACQWCKAKYTCSARAEMAMGSATEGFSIVKPESKPKFKDIKTMGNEEISRLLPYAPLISKWAKELTEYALKTAEGGETIDGYKLVEGRSVRKWRDEEEAAEALLSARVDEADIYVTKLISPTQAEKLVGKKNMGAINDSIHKPNGKPTLVIESDKRAAILGSSTDGFTAIN